MTTFRTTITRIAALTGAVACLGAFANPANAAAETFHEHDSFDPTGSVFACSPTDLTITGGTVRESLEGSLDAHGIGHFTGTIVPQNVTLTDGTNTYYLSGASWFGATGTDTPTVSTSTDHFVIRTASGGVYAKVSVVEHFSPNGSSFVKDTGACEAPAD
jgi:hypothetical protein